MILERIERLKMKEESKKNTGRFHKNVLGDCGYSDKKKYIEMASDEESEYYVPDKTMYSSKNDPYNKWNFTYNKERDNYICPQGKEMIFARKNKDAKGLEYKL